MPYLNHVQLSSLTLAVMGMVLSLFHFLYSPLTFAKGITTLDTFKVQSRPLSPTFQTQARVDAIRSSQISSQVMGSIVALPVKAGDAVKSGDLLIQIDSRLMENQKNAAQANVEVAKTQLRLAESDLQRNRQLLNQGFMSQAQFDRVKTQYESSIAQAKAQIAQAQASQTQMQFTHIRAPFHGLVSQLYTSLGDMAAPSKPLLTLYDPQTLRFVVNMPNNRITSLKDIQLKQFHFRLNGNDIAPSLLKKLIVIPSIDTQTQQQTFHIELSSDAYAITGLQLGSLVEVKVFMPNMALSAPITANTATTTSSLSSKMDLWIPQSAVFQQGELKAVYVVRNAESQPTVMLRLVKLGKSLGDEVLVLSGLNENDVIAKSAIAAQAYALPTSSRPTK